MKIHNPFRYFKTSPEIIRLAVMMYVRYPLSLRNVEGLRQSKLTKQLKAKPPSPIKRIIAATQLTKRSGLV